jgi:hypothetical protein
VRRIAGLTALLALTCASAASAQSIQLQASAGPTIIDPGYSLAAGGGLTIGSRVAMLLNVERTHIRSRVRRDGLGRVTSAFRGGTLTLAAPEIQVSLLPRHRVGPYGLAGFAAGESRPNVNDNFPNPVTNNVQAIFFGGGIQVPLANASIFADARLLIGAEGDDGIVGALPIRAGVAWRF